MDKYIMEVSNLRISYDENKEIIKNISFNVKAGEVVGYLGANGAGKSTTIKAILGINNNYEGEIKIFDNSIKNSTEYKKRIGYVPELAELYEVLSPKEYFLFFGSIYGMEEKDIIKKSIKLMEIFGIRDNFEHKISSFSKGMKQKVLIISSILHNPDLIIFDEPMSGLDANSVLIFKELLKQLAAEKKTIFFSSHILDVVEKISDRILLLKDGHIVADGPINELKTNNENLESLFSKLTDNADSEALAQEFINTIKGDKSCLF